VLQTRLVRSLSPVDGDPRGLTVVRQQCSLVSLRSHSQNPSSKILRWSLRSFLLISCCLALSFVISGCGASLSMGKGSAAAIVATPDSVTFGNLQVGNSATAQVTLLNRSLSPAQVSGLTISGKYFAITNQVHLPMTLLPGATYQVSVQYNPADTGSADGELTIKGDSTEAAGSVVHLSGEARKRADEISALECNNSVVAQAGTDTCTVKLNHRAPRSGLNVILSSSNALVTVPEQVTVPEHTSSVTFNATISAVKFGQRATLTATGDGSSATFNLQMGTPSSPVAALLTVNSSSVSFGSSALNSKATQTLTLTSAGTESVTISSAATSGAGFSTAGLTLPATLAPGGSATLNVVFDPTSPGTANGVLVIASNSSDNNNLSIPLQGTGVPMGVQLTWNSPASEDDPIAGYNVYRAPRSSSQFQLLTQSPDAQTAYTDSTVQTGQTYNYYVTSVDTSGAESTPSDTTSVSVPGAMAQSPSRVRITQ
jgi:Abnormal spindle-like microcephaly-assoc'd, ASPM-SPD-2-Hydin